MSRKPRRPAIVVSEPVRARAIRGPHQDGSGRWYWRAEVYQGGKGTGRTVWTGWAVRSEVARELADLIARDGLDRPAEPEHEIRTVQDLLEAWLGSRKEAADLEATTKAATEGQCKRLVGPPEKRTPLAAVLVSQLDRRHLEQHRDGSGYAEATVARDMKALRSAWRWGRDLGHVPDRSLPSLARKGTKKKRPKPVYTRFTPSEAEVAAVIEKLRRPWVRQGVILLYATGCRIGELAGLRWGAVAPYWPELPMRRGVLLCDVEDLEPHWEATEAASVILEGKTGPREVQLHPDVARDLVSWRPVDSDPTATVLGVSAGTAKTRIQDELAKAAEALGLPRLSPNGLRRAAERALYRTRESHYADPHPAEFDRDHPSTQPPPRPTRGPTCTMQP